MTSPAHRRRQRVRARLSCTPNCSRSLAQDRISRQPTRHCSPSTSPAPCPSIWISNKGYSPCAPSQNVCPYSSAISKPSFQTSAAPPPPAKEQGATATSTDSTQVYPVNLCVLCVEGFDFCGLR